MQARDLSTGQELTPSSSHNMLEALKTCFKEGNRNRDSNYPCWPLRNAISPMVINYGSGVASIAVTNWALSWSPNLCTTISLGVAGPIAAWTIYMAAAFICGSCETDILKLIPAPCFATGATSSTDTGFSANTLATAINWIPAALTGTVVTTITGGGWSVPLMMLAAEDIPASISLAFCMPYCIHPASTNGEKTGLLAPQPQSPTMNN